MMLSSFCLQRIVARSSSSSSSSNNLVRCLSSSSTTPQKRLTGKVISYQRNKAYGFIDSRDAGGERFFIHRTGIVSTIPADVNLFFPYLRTGDMVAFDVAEQAQEEQTLGSSSTAEGNNTPGLRRALNVTFANGETIPPYRKNYYAGALTRAKQDLGVKVWDIMQNVNLSEEEKISQVHAGFEEAKTEVERAEENIRSVGMKVEDFPTELVRRGDGRNKQKASSSEEPSSEHITPDESL